ncbi:hypothetical protein G7070_09480 [Propioniciclava coleopterorum]|uniref:Uncharacterized protein n=1 Tax=Propioniciclava coleopterorum TaxID=2714937 RepID=A0A6G7Y6L6_9ACTN|nr:hypothetical protein [Propioniciclava coleopterorum]QIK72455.1 hypothetical protein G7070_09480 [Propioniciclava coleopterorum]
MKVLRTCVLSLFLLLGSAGVLFSTAPTADAAANCTGSLTGSFAVHSTRGDKIGELDVYYSSANGGTNSACMRHSNRLWGVKSATGVQIAKCRSFTGGCSGVSFTDAGSQTGSYSYYAGPVKVTGTASRCVTVRGYVTEPGKSSRGIQVDNVGCRANPTVTERW